MFDTKQYLQLFGVYVFYNKKIIYLSHTMLVQAMIVCKHYSIMASQVIHDS